MYAIPFVQPYVVPFTTTILGDTLSPSISTTSNPGVNGQSVAGINTVAFRAYVAANALAPNLHAAAGGYFTNQYVTAAAYYGGNQYLHDTCYWCIAASSSGDSSLIAGGKGAILNFGNVQNGSSGLIPIAFSSSAQIVPEISQPPMLPAAILALQTASPDPTWLASAYTIAKLHHQFYVNNRTDPITHLAAWGTQNANGGLGGVDGADTSIVQTASESGQDEVGWIYASSEYTYLQLGVAANAQARMMHSCPDLSGFLAGSARDLALIAGILGNSADQAAFTTEYGLWQARIQKWQFDAQVGTSGGRFAMFQDSLTWANGGYSLASAVSVGDTVVHVAVPSGKALAVTDGAILIAGSVGTDGDALVRMQATGFVQGTNTTITVPIVAAPTAIASGTTIRVGRFSQIQTLAFNAVPLWAGAPSSAQATAVKNELMTVLDGSVDDGVRITFTPWISNPNATGSSGLMSSFGRFTPDALNSMEFRQIGPGYTEWNANWYDISYIDTSGLACIGLLNSDAAIAIYRRAASGEFGHLDRLYYDSSEMASTSNPLVIKVGYRQTATAKPTITIKDLSDNILASSGSIGAFGSADAEAVYTFAPSTPVSVKSVTVNKDSGADGVGINYVELRERPTGFAYKTPYGLLDQPRLAKHSFAALYSDPRDYQGTGPHNIVDIDYWKGQVAPYLQWHAVKGLLSYAQTEAARTVALLFVAAEANEYQAWLLDNSRGACREWIGMNGAAKGATQYGWTGLLLPIMDMAS